MAHKQGKIIVARGVRFGYCKIPARIEAIPQTIINDRQKRECGRMNGFGLGGNYESESTLAEFYEVSRKTISQDHNKIKMLRLVVWMNVKGKPTCYWLKSNPKVQAAKYLEYEGKTMVNPAYTCNLEVTGGVTSAGHKGVTSASHNLDRINKDISAALPTPAERQARRLKEKEELRLAERDAAIRREWEKLMPPRQRGDWAEIGRRIDVFQKLHEPVIKLMEGGLSAAEAVRKVFDENREMVTGGKQK